jgi:predicted nucleic acid-binding protein
MKPGATFDSSFWVHTVSLNLVEHLLEDYALVCPTAVEAELGRDNPSAVRLKTLCAAGRIERATPHTEPMTLYGLGERAAINLALERKLLLLIDDWRPYEAARAAGIPTVNTVVYLTHLGARGRLGVDQVIEALGRLARRGTIKPEWITLGVIVVAELRRQRREQEQER